MVVSGRSGAYIHIQGFRAADRTPGLAALT